MRILTYRKTRGSKNVTRHERNAERISTEITKGDTVRVMRGENKDKEGKVIKVDLKAGRVTVEGPGFKMLKKHRRARRAEEQSGIIELPRTIAISNVMLLDPKSGKPTRVRTRIDVDAKTKERTKERVSAKSGEPILRSR
ncbi:MAG: 50S ribosomal protein L24 [Gemmatimonadetes bacterium]|jgi:large subunit ribosomal protein L24|nr:50S ribosomal protein L24 [Gemmatimonadota bacterium]MBP7549087.1 50S ribosomal protein L24 [Gemmatimonadaceae bacterium]